MENIVLCRICLNANVYQIIKNTHLEIVYEKLTAMPFQTNDMRPLSVCYMCYAQLLTTNKFMLKCLRAEDLLTELLNKLVYTEEEDKAMLIDKYSQGSELSVSPVLILTNKDEDMPNDEIEDVDIKEELVLADEQYAYKEDIIVPGDVTPVTESPGASVEQDPLEEIPDEQERSPAVSCKSDETHDTRDDDDDVLDDQALEVPVKINDEDELMSHIERSDVPSKDTMRLNIAPDIGTVEGSLTDLFNKTNIIPYVTNFWKPETQDNCVKYNNTITSNNGTIVPNLLSIQHSVNNENQLNIKTNLETLIDPQKDVINRSIEKDTDKIYTCDVIEKSFNKKSVLANDATTQTSEKRYNCDVCGIGFLDKHVLRLHGQTHTGDKPFVCSVCNMSFTQNSTLLQHAIVHSGEKRFPCDVCKKSFYWKHDLITHSIQHSNAGAKKFSCEMCNINFSNLLSLKSHLLLHINDKHFTCDLCNKSFISKQYLRTHLREHAAVKPNTYNVCDKRQSDPAGSSHHADDKLFTCNVCNQSFSNKYYLSNHLWVHTGVKSYRCNACNKSFACPKSLSQHTKEKHNQRQPIVRKLFTCNVCNKRFLTKSWLKQHSCVHIGVKAYKCNACEKSYNYPAGLRKHKRLKHTGDKTYTRRHPGRQSTGAKTISCDVCGRQFSRKFELKNHMRVHTGEKPYTCSMCNARYAYRSGLRHHNQRHHS